MRPVETLLLALMVVVAATVFVGRRPGRSFRLAMAAPTVLALGLLGTFEGLRWQMFPAIGLLTLGLVLLWTRRGAPDPRRLPGRVARMGRGLARWILLPVATLLAIFLPASMLVPHFPEPMGPYDVGVTDFAVTFADRPEILTATEGDVREIAVRAWYPAVSPEDRATAPYMTPQEFDAFTGAFGSSIPGAKLVFAGAPLARTNAYRDADVAAADRGFPVLQFSHGYSSFPAQNTPLMEHLASHGYVVFSLAHTYDGSVVFPDGRVMGLGPHIEAWTAQSLEHTEEMMADMEVLVRGSDPDVRLEVVQRIRDQSARDEARGLGVSLSWGVWVQDRVGFLDVLEELQSGKRSSRFEGRLDLDRIGLLGMSFGGATAAEACHVDARCKAAMNLDGGHMYAPDTDLLDGHIARPLLMVHSSDPTTFRVPSSDNVDDFQAYNDFFYEPIAERGRRRDVVRMRVDGTSHLHLTDLSLMVRWIPVFGSRTPGPRIAEILNRYATAFFDEALRGRRAPLLDGPDPEYPEVSFQSFGGPLPRRVR